MLLFWLSLFFFSFFVHHRDLTGRCLRQRQMCLRDKSDDLLLVIPRVTDKNVRFHDGLLSFADFLHEFFVVGIIPMLDQQKLVSEPESESIVLVSNFRLFNKSVYSNFV